MADIFKVDLRIITSDIKIDSDNKRKNIKGCDSEVVETIYVKPYNNSYYKEIITGIKIPVYYVDTNYEFDEFDYKTYRTDDTHHPPKHPYFITILLHYNDTVLFGSSLIRAQYGELKEYIDNNSQTFNKYEAFRNKLNDHIKTANDRYNNAYEKYQETSDKGIKLLLKDLNEKRKNGFRR